MIVSKLDDDDLLKDIDELIDYTKDEFLEEILELSRDHYVEGFDKGGYQTNQSRGGWSRRQDDESHPILEKTGRLRDSIVIQGSQVVSTSPYGVYHNEGTGRLPQREFMGESDELYEKIEKLIEDKFTNLLD